MSDWLELELADNLAPAPAPDELWERVADAAAAPARRRRLILYPAALPIAAVVTLVLAGALWFVARGQQPQTSFRPFPASARAENCLLCHTTL
jgi:hypothetical protein